MNDKNKNESFRYTYSAREQAELKNIRAKYIAQEESPLERIRRLDNKVTEKAQITSLILGIVGTLFLGFGLSLILSDLKYIFGGNNVISIIIGSILGIIGVIPISAAYPAYNYILKREREKIAPEIIRLTDELMK